MVIEKLERVIYYPCSGLCLKHQVSFSNIIKQNKRRKSEVSIFNYKTNKYSDTTEVNKINLESSDFLILEITNVDKKIYKDEISICISYPHLISLKKVIDEALSWSDEYDNLYIETRDERIVLNGDYYSLQAQSDNFVGNRYIIIKPELYETDDEIEEGFRIFFSDTISVGISLTQMEGLYDFIDNFNLYESSQLLINYYTVLMTNQEHKIPIYKFVQKSAKDKILEKQRRKTKIIVEEDDE